MFADVLVWEGRPAECGTKQVHGWPEPVEYECGHYLLCARYFDLLLPAGCFDLRGRDPRPGHSMAKARTDDEAY